MTLSNFKLGDIATFGYGKMPDKRKVGTGSYELFSGYKYLGKYPETNCKNGDLVVVARGVGGTGDVKIARGDCYLTNLSIRISLDSQKAVNKYVFYKFSLKNLRHLDSGSAQSQITIRDLANLKLTLPSITTQKTVVDLISRYDSLIENNEKRIKIFEEMARRIYTEWFVKFRFPGHEKVKMVDSPLGKIPEGWFGSVSDFCSYISRGVTPKYKEGSGIFIINQKVNQGWVLNENNFKELDPSLVIPEEKLVRKWDVLINSLGEGTIGRTHLYRIRSSFPFDQHMTLCRSNDSYKSVFLYFYLSSDVGQKRLMSFKTGGTNMTMLNISDLRKFQLLHPNDEILKEFAEIVQPKFEEINLLEDQNKVIAKIRDLLIPQLVTGRRELK